MTQQSQVKHETHDLWHTKHTTCGTRHLCHTSLVATHQPRYRPRNHLHLCQPCHLTHECDTVWWVCVQGRGGSTMVVSHGLRVCRIRMACAVFVPSCLPTLKHTYAFSWLVASLWHLGVLLARPQSHSMLLNHTLCSALSALPSLLCHPCFHDGRVRVRASASAPQSL